MTLLGKQSKLHNRVADDNVHALGHSTADQQLSVAGPYTGEFTLFINRTRQVTRAT